MRRGGTIRPRAVVPNTNHGRMRGRIWVEEEEEEEEEEVMVGG